MRAMRDPLAEARAFFSPAQGSIYLDAATYGLPPRPTVEAMQHGLAAWQAGTADWIHDWDERGEDCRASFATLIGAQPREIALVPTGSVGVATVAASLTAADNVLLADDEFTSVVYPLMVAAQDRGARIRSVKFDQLAESIEPGTTLVAFSLIQSQSGRGAALDAIQDACQNTGARSLVDATHAVPFVPLAAHIERIDYLVCAAYKHLLCPRGVGFLYVASKHWDRIPPVLANWRSSSQPYANFYGPPLDLAADAARFDVSLAWLAWVGAQESLRLLVEWQRSGALDLARDLARRLGSQLGLSEPLGSVVTVPVEDAERVREALAERGVRASVRTGGVRLSPHVYNSVEHIDLAIEALAPYVRVPAAR
jgi:selenocysteine lyase/cysteine desulfurase